MIVLRVTLKDACSTSYVVNHITLVMLETTLV